MTNTTIDYCAEDKQGEHYWQSLGIGKLKHKTVLEVFKCMQCKKVKLKELEIIGWDVGK